MRWMHADGEVRDSDPKCWGVYIRGADDWIAHVSRKKAEEAALAFNERIVAGMHYDENDPWDWAIPDLWPWDQASHDAALRALQEV